MESLQSLLGQRVREARKRAGLTQPELARAAGFAAPQTISQIENGERDVKAWELVSLAKALAVSMQDLLRQEPFDQPVVLWREMPKAEAGLKEASFLNRYRRSCFVQRVTGMNANVPLPRWQGTLRQMSYAQAAGLAEGVRRSLELGDRPAYALLEAVEQRYGIQIWYADLEHDGSAAAHVDSAGAAVLLSSVEPPWRRNYSFAHELFHIVTWDPTLIEEIKQDRALFERNEKLANAFASALLLPAEAVRTALKQAAAVGEVSYAMLVAIAGDFEVSTAALLWRLANMGILQRGMVQALLDDPALSAIDAASRKGKWWTPPELPARFVRLCYLAWQQGHLSRARLAEYLETDLSRLDETLGQYGLSEHGAGDEVDLSFRGADCFSLEDEEWPVLVPSA